MKYLFDYFFKINKKFIGLYDYFEERMREKLNELEDVPNKTI